MIRCLQSNSWRASVLGLALLGFVCVTGAAVSEPDPLRSRPDVAAWVKQADASPDKIEVWRKAAKEGNAFVKELAVQELVKLEDEKGLAILQELRNERPCLHAGRAGL